jgi:phosphoribosyl 1,2-cyclic phosphodiesterase
VHIYGRQREIHLKDIFCTQTDEPYFPVNLDEVAAKVSYVELMEGASFKLGRTTVSCSLLNHPGLAIGYRMEADNHAVAYVSDTAPFDRILHQEGKLSKPPTGPPTEDEIERLQVIRGGIVDLCRGADVLIYDTMFTMDEYNERPHWGHSSYSHAVEMAEEAGAAAVALYHHAPDRSDSQLDEICEQVQATTSVKVVVSAEGTELILTDDGVELEPVTDFVGVCSGEAG